MRPTFRQKNMKRHKTKETEPCSTDLNWPPRARGPHEVFSLLKMNTEGEKDTSTYTEDIYTYLYVCINPLILSWTRPLAKDNLH